MYLKFSKGCNLFRRNYMTSTRRRPRSPTSACRPATLSRSCGARTHRFSFGPAPAPSVRSTDHHPPAVLESPAGRDPTHHFELQPTMAVTGTRYARRGSELSFQFGSKIRGRRELFFRQLACASHILLYNRIKGTTAASGPLLVVCFAPFSTAPTDRQGAISTPQNKQRRERMISATGRNESLLVKIAPFSSFKKNETRQKQNKTNLCTVTGGRIAEIFF